MKTLKQMLEANQQTEIQLFTNLPNEFITLFSPFITSEDLEIMDIEFSVLHENRYVASIFTSLYPDVSKLSNFIFSRMRKRWMQISKDYRAEYSPIENYQITEVLKETVGDSVSNRGTEVSTETVGDNVSNTGTVTTDYNDENGIFGFNSIESRPSNNSDSQQVVTNDVTTKGDKTVDKTLTNDVTTIGDKTIDKTLTKTGKIGYISSQNFPDLIEADIKLWRESDLMKSIYNDVASIIFIKYYGSGN